MHRLPVAQKTPPSIANGSNVDCWMSCTTTPTMKIPLHSTHWKNIPATVNIDRVVCGRWMQLCVRHGQSCVRDMDRVMRETWVELCVRHRWSCVWQMDGVVWETWMELCERHGRSCVRDMDIVWETFFKHVCEILIHWHFYNRRHAYLCMWGDISLCVCEKACMSLCSTSNSIIRHTADDMDACKIRKVFYTPF